MSMNWQLKDLVGRLKKQHVMARQIVVGDVVVSDFGCWQVAKIEQEAGGLLSILDDSDNGLMSVPPHEISIIVHRGCFGN
jgi:hypothetical protein